MIRIHVLFYDWVILSPHPPTHTHLQSELTPSVRIISCITRRRGHCPLPIPPTPLLPLPSAPLLQAAGRTAVHLFRSVLVALASPKTFAGGLYMERPQQQQPGSSSVAPPDGKAWRRHFDVTFVDASGWLNLAAPLSAAALAQARACASRSLQALNVGTPEAFAAVFLARQRQAALFDLWFHVTVPVTVPPPEAAAAAPAAAALRLDQPTWRCAAAVAAAAAAAAAAATLCRRCDFTLSFC